MIRWTPIARNFGRITQSCRYATEGWITCWVVRSTRLLDQVMGGGALDLPALAEPALFVPETMTMMTLEQFKRTHLPVALVVDEFGDTKGLVSLTDVTSSIVGDLPAGARNP